MDKMNHPLVSIVFTSYNHKEYLRQALDSLLNQTYPNTEIIIIDDCSTDGSQEILWEYEHIENINLQMQSQNSGSYVKASNLGASFAKGEYMLFAQCDDFADPTQIEKLYQSFVLNPKIGVSFSKSIMVDSHGNYLHDDLVGREFKFKKAIERSSLISGSEMFKYLCFSCVIPNLSAALIKRDLFIEVKNFSEKFIVVADWYFWFLLSKKTNFYYINEPLNYFRQHETTIRSTVKISKQVVEIYSMFNFLKKEFALTNSDKNFIDIRFGAICFAYIIEDKKEILSKFKVIYNEMINKCPKFSYYLFIGFLIQISEYVKRKIL